MSELTLTLVQPDLVWESPQANFSKINNLLSDTTSTDLIILPEMFPTGFSMNPQEMHEEKEGPGFQFMVKLAHQKDAAVCGSIITRDNSKYYNRLYFVYPDGSYKTYDKRHLFSYGGEHKIYDAGNEHLIVEYKGWRIMPLICYDLRFPVWCRNTAEADLQIYVANWPERRSMAWRVLLQARAIENMCCVAGLNRVGEDANAVDHSGDSAVYDELGKQRLALTAGKEEVSSVSLKKESIAENRDRFHFLDDRDQFSFND